MFDLKDWFEFGCAGPGKRRSGWSSVSCLCEVVGAQCEYELASAVSSQVFLGRAIPANTPGCAPSKQQPWEQSNTDVLRATGQKACYLLDRVDGPAGGVICTGEQKYQQDPGKKTTTEQLHTMHLKMVIF